MWTWRLYIVGNEDLSIREEADYLQTQGIFAEACKACVNLRMAFP